MPRMNIQLLIFIRTLLAQNRKEKLRSTINQFPDCLIAAAGGYAASLHAKAPAPTPEPVVAPVSIQAKKILTMWHSNRQPRLPSPSRSVKIWNRLALYTSRWPRLTRMARWFLF